MSEKKSSQWLPEGMSELLADAESLGPSIVELRRRIHRRPELGLENPHTKAVIAEELARIGIDTVIEGESTTALVADIEGRGQGPGAGRCVALRADTDALPLLERTGLEWASEIDGCMHACGHDAHVAMLLGAAEILHRRRDSFAGRVRLLFQPGEEGWAGAMFMIADGALDGVDAAFAIHVGPNTPRGLLTLRSGTMLASVDTFTVTFHGAGGHASMPHLARDPIPAIGPFVDGLSHVVARETDPEDRIVLGVSRVIAGTTDNVIPPSAECLGTIRALTPGARAAAERKLRRVAEGVAASQGLEVQVNVVHGYPPTMNDAMAVELISECAPLANLEPREMLSPIMGAEDFSYVLERVPGAMAFLGCQVQGATGSLHSDIMVVDESVLPHGAALHVAVALRFLAETSLAP